MRKQRERKPAKWRHRFLGGCRKALRALVLPPFYGVLIVAAMLHQARTTNAEEYR
jgi:hypothetical protein